MFVGVCGSVCVLGGVCSWVSHRYWSPFLVAWSIFLICPLFLRTKTVTRLPLACALALYTPIPSQTVFLCPGGPGLNLCGTVLPMIGDCVDVYTCTCAIYGHG